MHLGATTLGTENPGAQGRGGEPRPWPGGGMLSGSLDTVRPTEGVPTLPKYPPRAVGQLGGAPAAGGAGEDPDNPLPGGIGMEPAVLLVPDRDDTIGYVPLDRVQILC